MGKNGIILRFWGLALVSVSIAFFGGCTPVVRENTGTPSQQNTEKMVGESAHYPVTVETLDSKKKLHKETFAETPRRVVAVWQNSIETLLALGVGDRIVAAMGLPSGEYLRPEYRETYDRIPYTSMENLDVETVMMTNPDLIVGWASTFDAKVLRGTDFWESRGIHTYISPGSSSAVKEHTVDYEYRDILNMGKIFDREEKAEEIVSQMEAEIKRAENSARALGRHPRGLVIEYLGKNINVYGRRTLAGDIVKRMGGELLAEDAQQISKEQLIELDPDAIFVVVIERDYGQEKQILDHIYGEKALQGLRCVKERRIYPLPLYAIYSAGVRTYDGIQIIEKGLYPDLYKE